MGIAHQPEFTTSPNGEAEQKKRDLSACYYRAFTTPDGARVLEDLRAKFGLGRLIFSRAATVRHDPIAAAIIDGERGVMSDIEAALILGKPGTAPLKKKGRKAA